MLGKVLTSSYTCSLNCVQNVLNIFHPGVPFEKYWEQMFGIFGTIWLPCCQDFPPGFFEVVRYNHWGPRSGQRRNLPDEKIVNVQDMSPTVFVLLPTEGVILHGGPKQTKQNMREFRFSGWDGGISDLVAAPRRIVFHSCFTALGISHLVGRAAGGISDWTIGMEEFLI